MLVSENYEKRQTCYALGAYHFRSPQQGKNPFPPLPFRGSLRNLRRESRNSAARFDLHVRLGYKGIVAMTKEPDPEELLRQARAGSKPALGSLLELYSSYLELLARLQIGRRLQGKVDAADLVQETFLRAHQFFEQFEGSTEAELVAWLRQILASRLADLVRRYHG